MACVCQHCRSVFPTFYSLRAHQNGKSRGGIPFCERTQPVDVGADDYSDADDDSSASAAVAVVRNPFDIKHEICRRHQQDTTLGPAQPLQNLGSDCVHSYTGSVNYGSLLSAFVAYCKWVLQSRSVQFWKLYLATRHLPTEQQRDILELVQKHFQTTTYTANRPTDQPTNQPT